jgi:hypothetical protein
VRERERSESCDLLLSLQFYPRITHVPISIAYGRNCKSDQIVQKYQSIILLNLRGFFRVVPGKVIPTILCFEEAKEENIGGQK